MISETEWDGEGLDLLYSLLCTHSHLFALPSPSLLLEIFLAVLSLPVPDDFTDVFSPQ